MPSPFKLPCSRIPVPFTVRRPDSERHLQPDLNLKGPLIIEGSDCGDGRGEGPRGDSIAVQGVVSGVKIIYFTDHAFAAVKGRRLGSGIQRVSVVTVC